MSAIVESVWGPVTEATYNLGLLGYPNSAFVRLAVGTLATGIVLVLWKPDWFFATIDDRTVPMVWSVTAPESSAAPKTAFPWWAAALSVGVAFALFV